MDRRQESRNEEEEGGVGVGEGEEEGGGEIEEVGDRSHQLT